MTVEANNRPPIHQRRRGMTRATRVYRAFAGARASSAEESVSR